jgi:hypothetical protein
MRVSNTITQYMVAADAEPDNDFAGHSVGLDSAVGLHVITAEGLELNFDMGVQESIYEALFDFFKRRHAEQG